ncbi:MAG TPA: hypothetical protein VIS57_11470, partial [Xanthomonadales bacterium]
QVSLFEISINSNSPGVEIAGGGTGIEIAGGGTGSKTQIAGGGTGIEIAGGGTGIEIAGGGTGIEIAGGGTGIDSVYITLPTGTGLELEIEMGCNSATVSVLDSTDFSEVVSFNNIQVLGDTGLCQVASNGSRQGFEKKAYRETTS